MNNRDEVVGTIIDWLNVESLAYTLKENDSDRFWATIQLSQNLNVDIQLTTQKPDCVLLLTHAYLGPDDQRAYSRLDRKERVFSSSCQMGTAQYRCGPPDKSQC